MKFFDTIAKVETVHNWVRHYAGTLHHGPTGYLARNCLDKLALAPVDVRT